MKWFGLFLLNVVATLTAWFFVALALPFARPMDRLNCFPSWLQWLNTPDDPGCNQGTYETQVLDVFARFGWYVKTWYWLSIRNRMYGLFAMLCAKYDGSPVTEVAWWKFKVYSCQGYKEITYPMHRVSFGYKVHTLKTAKKGDPIWWVCMPALWKSREY